MAAHSYELCLGLSELSRLLFEDDGLDDALDPVARLACRTIGGCDMAAVSLVRGGHPTTAACTDPAAAQIDAAESDSGVGPGLDAWRYQRVFRIDSTVDDKRWRLFSDACVSHGIMSTASFPLGVSGKGLGALKLYSRAANAFSEADDEVATLFGCQTGAALALAPAHLAAGSYKMTEQLHEALASRMAIQQAKAILMVSSAVTSDQAFDMLRRTAQAAHVRLRVIAQQVVDRHEAWSGQRLTARRGCAPQTMPGSSPVASRPSS